VNDLTLVKILITPILMVAISCASRVWGGSIGGLLAGLPITSGPISIYFAAEQGIDFAIEAARSSIVGVNSVIAFYIMYVISASSLSAAITVMVSCSAFMLSSTILYAVNATMAVAIMIAMAAIVLLLKVCSKRQSCNSKIIYAAWDLPARIAASTAMVLLLTWFANVIGPKFSGLLAPVPVIAWPLLVFAHVQKGASEAIDVVAGTAVGLVGIVVFYTIVYYALARYGMALAYGAALSASVLVTLPFAWYEARRRT
jgi:hypothetical protein